MLSTDDRKLDDHSSAREHAKKVASDQSVVCVSAVHRRTTSDQILDLRDALERG
jgi:hypothetical protein